MVCEFLGIAPLGSGSVPAVLEARTPSPRAAGALAMDLLQRGVRPRDILTREAFENAIAGVVATGGSTNAVLHLLAIAREAGVDAGASTTSTAISDRTPLIVDLKPGGRFVATDLHAAGGMPLVAQAPGRGRPARTATRRRSPAGRSARKRRRPRRRRPGGRATAADRRSRRPAASSSCTATSRPRAASSRSPATRRSNHRGPARVFDSEEAAFAAVQRRPIKAGDVVVIRYEGPSGGPGMREMLA